MQPLFFNKNCCHTKIVSSAILGGGDTHVTFAPKHIANICAPREKIAMSIGIPIKLLHEAEGHIVTLETTTGEIYRGKLMEAEDNMNCQMQGITVTGRDGRVTQIEQVFIRGSMIRFLILPDMLKNAPMFKPKSAGSRGLSAGGGKSAMLRAQGL